MCNKKCSITLHDYVRKKVDYIQHQCNSEASEERKDGEVAAGVSLSLNTVLEVISMCVVPVKLRHDDSGETQKTYSFLESCGQGTFVLERLLKWGFYGNVNLELIFLIKDMDNFNDIPLQIYLKNF